MWYIYTVDYYSTIKNNDFMKFAGKGMKLESIDKTVPHKRAPFHRCSSIIISQIRLKCKRNKMGAVRPYSH